MSIKIQIVLCSAYFIRLRKIIFMHLNIPIKTYECEYKDNLFEGLTRLKSEKLKVEDELVEKYKNMNEF